jgi:predicted nucleic acid-binding protein
MPLLLDTNVLIYNLQGALSADVKATIRHAMDAKQAYISVITRIEVLGWKGYNDTTLQQMGQLLSKLIEIPLTEAVVQDTIRVRKEFGLKLPDAVIAASAMVQGIALLTGNVDDFKRVANLQVHSIWPAELAK